MSDPSFALWVYLSKTPLLWLALTLLSYAVADRIAAATGRHPLANPVLMAVCMIAALLLITGTPYPVYFNGAQFVHFLLGPATVALAWPLYENRSLVRRSLLPMLVALGLGSVTAILSVVLIARGFGIPASILASVAPKSVTAAVAMGISTSLGGDASLTAVAVIVTGIIGAMVVTPMMNALGIKDWRARGFAVGIASHGIGTARAFQVHPIAGTFAGVAMGLNALLTAFLVPIILRALGI
jgi:predicted murein hydrolase (TIGR00659 family)